MAKYSEKQVNGNYITSSPDHYNPITIFTLPLRRGERPYSDFPDLIRIVTSPNHIEGVIKRAADLLPKNNATNIIIEGDNLLSVPQKLDELLSSKNRIVLELEYEELIKASIEQKKIIDSDKGISLVGIKLRNKDIAGEFENRLKRKESFITRFTLLGLQSWIRENILGVMNDNAEENSKQQIHSALQGIKTYFIVDDNISINNLDLLLESNSNVILRSGSNNDIEELRKYIIEGYLLPNSEKTISPVSLDLLYEPASSLRISKEEIEKLDLVKLIPKRFIQDITIPNPFYKKTLIVDSINGLFIDPVTEKRMNWDEIGVKEFINL